MKVTPGPWVQALMDRFDIMDAIVKYTAALDGRYRNLFESCFTKEIELDISKLVREFPRNVTRASSGLITACLTSHNSKPLSITQQTMLSRSTGILQRQPPICFPTTTCQMTKVILLRPMADSGHLTFGVKQTAGVSIGTHCARSGKQEIKLSTT